MTQPYSEDLRERAMARLTAGETIRSIAAALSISPSCVSKWKRRLAETGALTPGRIGGHKKRTLSDESGPSGCANVVALARSRHVGWLRSLPSVASRPTAVLSGCLSGLKA
ncbi:hypothetical protein ELH07_16140 [Rhizobium ruizarguesonis]|nr:hypothetical protein ELH07_16140 [Rhizobium ruizarguesonis]